MITVGIIDDEPRVADGLRKIIEKYLYRKARVVFVCHSVKDAVSQIRIHKPNIIFLDVEMPGENGFELFSHFDEPDFKVVITTAYREYAINAIKHSALDYLLKPVNHTELIELFVKIEKQAKNTRLKFQVETLVANLNNADSLMSKIAFPSQSGIEFIKVNNIVYCQAENTYTTIFTNLNESIVVTRTLKAVEELLPQHLFLRIHKSYLVNMNYIKSFTRSAALGIILENGMFLPVANGKSRDIIAMVKNE